VPDARTIDSNTFSDEIDRRLVRLGGELPVLGHGQVAPVALAEALSMRIVNRMRQSGSDFMAKDGIHLPLDGGINRLRRRTVAVILAMSILTAWSVLDLQDVFGLTDFAVSAGALHNTFRVVTMISALALAGYLILKHDRPILDQIHVGPPRPANDIDTAIEIFKAESYCHRTYQGSMSRLFTEMLTNMPNYLFRVSEDIKLTQGQLEIDTTLHFRTQTAVDRDSPAEIAGQTILVPVIMASKGLLFDNLQVKDASGRVLPTLSQWETQGLTTLVVRSLFGVVADSPLHARGWRQRLRDSFGNKLSRQSREELETAFVEIIVDAIGTVGGPARIAPDGIEMARDLHERREHALNQLDELKTRMPAEIFDRLTEVCRALTENYLIVAEVPRPAGTNLIVQYTYDSVEERSLARGQERLRARLGLDSYIVDVPMPRILQADSYHCQITAPAGLYVFSHHLEALGGKDPLKQEDFTVGGVQQYVRLHHEESRTVAHLYVRRHGSAITASDVRRSQRIGAGVKSVLLLREKPPGTLGSAATLAAVVASVVLFLTIARLGLSSGQPSGSSLLGFLFTVPAFISAALGRGVDGSRLSRSSLITYFGLLLVFVMSIGASLLYALDASLDLPTEVVIKVWPGAAGWHTDWLWIIFSLLTWGVAIFLIRERRDQTRYYLDNLQRASDRHNGQPAEDLTPPGRTPTLTGR
jgi:hypothetical protein